MHTLHAVWQVFNDYWTATNCSAVHRLVQMLWMHPCLGTRQHPHIYSPLLTGRPLEISWHRLTCQAFILNMQGGRWQMSTGPHLNAAQSIVETALPGGSGALGIPLPKHQVS